MPVVYGRGLQWKTLYELQVDIKTLSSEQIPLEVEFYHVDHPERSMRIGGVWSPFLADFVDGRSYEKRKRVALHDAQWKFLSYIAEALRLSAKHDPDKVPIQDVIFHGGRRSGKSVGLAAAALMWAMAKPASVVWVVSLRKRHGERIMRLIKRWLPFESWTMDKRDSTLWFANYSSIRAINEKDFNSERGDSVDLLILDEAAFMKEDVYNALAPSVYDRNGTVAMASSPNGFNWFYDRAMLAASENEKARQSVRVVGMSMLDNPFLSDAAKAHALTSAETLGIDAYRQEVEGQFKSPVPLVFEGFSEKIHVRRRNEMWDERIDMMMEIGERIFNLTDIKFFVGVDFNYNPTAGVIVQFDRRGRLWVIDEHVGTRGTEAWAQTLESRLRDLGATNPRREAIIIADASGQWQGEGRHAPHNRATWKMLRAMRWTVFGPSVGKVNPWREDRFEVIRALLMSAKGEPRFFVDPDAVEILEMVKKLPIRNNLPSKSSEHIHIYDALTYVAYRIWGTSAGRELWGHDLVFSPLDGD